MCDLFLDQGNNYFTNYADDTTPYVVGDNTIDVLSSLTKITQELFTWSANNQAKANHGKCHLLLSSHENANIQIANVTIKSSISKKLLRVTNDSKLKFDKHVENICPKASIKLNALTRLVNYIDLPKRRILKNAFFNAQFNYCPTIWMFHSRSLNNKITRLHERCLKMIYNDKQSNFEEVLVRDNSVSTHHRNIQRLAFQMYMVANGMSPNITSEFFS